VAGASHLMPLYDTLSDAIRSVDTETIIFYEPATWGILYPSGVLGSGFNRVPGGSSFNNRSALSYHYYCWLDPGDNQTAPYPPLKRYACDEFLGPLVIKTVVDEVQLTGGALFMTEWGICSPNGDNSTEGTIECEAVMKLADDYLQSWTYWDGGFYLPDGNVNLPKVKSFARTYAQAIAGHPLEMSFNVSTAQFSFSYAMDVEILAPTEIFIPTKIHYPNGYDVKTSDNIKWKVSPDNGNIIFVTPVDSHNHSLDNTALIRISPKAK